MSMNERPQAIFFDWDGTLVNSVPGIYKAHNRVREHYGHKPWGWEDFQSIIPYSTRQIYPRLYGDKAEEMIAYLYEVFDKCHLDDVDLMPGAEALIKQIAKMNIPMAVISNKRHQNLVKEIAHLKWEAHFPGVVGAGFAVADKPDAAPFRHALTFYNPEPEPFRVWYVGDTETDLKMAKAAGCKSVLVHHEEGAPSLIERFEPDLHVTDCFELGKQMQNFA